MQTELQCHWCVVSFFPSEEEAGFDLFCPVGRFVKITGIKASARTSVLIGVVLCRVVLSPPVHGVKWTDFVFEATGLAAA